MSSLQGGNRVQGLIRCESCPKSFAVRGQYNRHRKTHTKPYRCGHCEEGFALRNDLDRHKTKHGGQVDTKFYCKWPNCPFKGASRRDNLLRHIHNAHGWKSATESQNIQAKARAVYQKCLKEQKASTERLSFMKSVQSGNVSMVTLLLQNGADIAERNDIGQTSLHIAVANGNSEMIQVLLNAGIDIEGMDNDNKTALYYATRTGNEAIIQILIRHGAGASIVKRNKNGSTMLHDISASGDEVTLRLLVDRQVELDTDIDTADNEKMTALYRAATNGHSAVVAILLATGAGTIGRSKSLSTYIEGRHRTALRVAAARGHEAVVDLLLSAGYVPTIWELKSAVIGGHEAIVERLLAAGADVNTSSAYGWTPLQAATNNNHEAIVEILIAAGVDVNMSSAGGWTALQAATSNGHETIVEILLAAGVDVNMSSAYGWTPLQAAIDNNHEAIVEMLLAAGADVNTSSAYGWTPLQAATYQGHKGIIDMLVGAGAMQ